MPSSWQASFCTYPRAAALLRPSARSQSRRPPTPRGSSGRHASGSRVDPARSGPRSAASDPRTRGEELRRARSHWQFPNVPRPTVRAQARHRVGLEPARAPARPRTRSGAVRELDHVIGSLAKRRQLDPDHVEDGNRGSSRNAPRALPARARRWVAATSRASVRSVCGPSDAVDSWSWSTARACLDRRDILPTSSRTACRRSPLRSDRSAGDRRRERASLVSNSSDSRSVSGSAAQSPSRAVRCRANDRSWIKSRESALCRCRSRRSAGTLDRRGATRRRARRRCASRDLSATIEPTARRPGALRAQLVHLRE